VGMAQAYVPRAMDAWSYALERGKPYFTAPSHADAPNDFAPDATRLGTTTRVMHEALASDDDDPAFAPLPATREDLAAWALQTRHTIRNSLSLLERRLGASDFPR